MNLNLKDIANKGGKAFYVIAELTDPDKCKNTVKFVIEKFDRQHFCFS